MKNPSIKQQCLFLYAQHYSVAEIAQKVGRARGSVYYHLRSFGITPRKPRKDNKHNYDDALMYFAHRNGVTLDELGSFYGVVKSVVHARIKAYELGRAR